MANSNYVVIDSKTFSDPLQPESECRAVLGKDPDSDEIAVAVFFSRSGILRSRPLLTLAVDAALNASWLSFYHSLFGDEAAAFAPRDLIEKEALKDGN